MLHLGRCLRLLLIVVSAAVWCGCFPAGTSQADEEKEPHYLAGKSRVSGMDYQGAIEEFERALDVNPRSAAAHRELGILLGQQADNPAAAIYHYEKYLELRPGAENADIVRQQIMALKQELAKGLMAMPSPTGGGQQQVNQLIEENRRLKEELERLRTAGGTKSGDTATETAPRSRPDQSQVTKAGTAATAGRTGGFRTYRVVSGDTPISIARKYHVALDALMAANPGLNERRMQVGQSLNIPPP